MFFCQRFTVKMGHKGIYSMKVSLLDCDKKDIPGRNFYCSALLPPLFTTVSLSSAETWKWDCLGHTFSDYPSGLRFIRFEDTMQSGTSFPTSLPKEWRNKLSIPEVLPYYGAGTDIYDVQAFGATVKISKRYLICSFVEKMQYTVESICNGLPGDRLLSVQGGVPL